MEAYSVAKALEAKKRSYKVIPNQELLALGASNIVGSLFQSYPVTGGFSRSAVNFQSGANTPLSSIISAVLVALTLMFLTPAFYYLPQAILASVIMVAVVGLIDMPYARGLWRKDKVEFALLAVTFLVTLNFSMVTWDCFRNSIFDSNIILYKAAYPHVALLGRVQNSQEFRNLDRFDDLTMWENLLIMRVDAPYAFINIQTIKERIIREVAKNDKKVSHVVMDASSVSYVDATALQGLKDLILELDEMQVQLVFTSVIGPVRDTFKRNGILDQIGSNIFLNTHQAIKSLTGEEVVLHQDHAIQANS